MQLKTIGKMVACSNLEDYKYTFIMNLWTLQDFLAKYGVIWFHFAAQEERKEVKKEF